MRLESAETKHRKKQNTNADQYDDQTLDHENSRFDRWEIMKILTAECRNNGSLAGSHHRAATSRR
ncbi:MAG TPA: hypothetical protein PLI12_03020, partial [Acetobacteraceae bacterium]|nr:hypothetical protein [Acetobacteraceae bacterium]